MRDNDKIQKMREAGDILSQILLDIRNGIKIGVSMIELDQIAMESCKKYNVRPAFKGYMDFPAAICVGVNDTVVHGIPDDYRLVDGDMLSVDMGIEYKKVYSDSAFTTHVGTISKETERFIKVVHDSLYLGIDQAVVGNNVGDIGHAIDAYVSKHGYAVVKEMVGHGIGYKLHENPYIPGYGKKGSGSKLTDGQTIAIEVIINQGSPSIYISQEDGWTSKTKDGMLSALFEHTVVVGKNPEILTKW